MLGCLARSRHHVDGSGRRPCGGRSGAWQEHCRALVHHVPRRRALRTGQRHRAELWSHRAGPRRYVHPFISDDAASADASIRAVSSEYRGSRDLFRDAQAIVESTIRQAVGSSGPSVHRVGTDRLPRQNRKTRIYRELLHINSIGYDALDRRSSDLSPRKAESADRTLRGGH